jgi:hypothetical protein
VTDRRAPGAISDALLAYRGLGLDEVRLNLRVSDDVPRTEAIAWMTGVVERVHAG